MFDHVRVSRDPSEYLKVEADDAPGTYLLIWQRKDGKGCLNTGIFSDILYVERKGGKEYVLLRGRGELLPVITDKGFPTVVQLMEGSPNFSMVTVDDHGCQYINPQKVTVENVRVASQGLLRRMGVLRSITHGSEIFLNGCRIPVSKRPQEIRQAILSHPFNNKVPC